MSTPDTPELMPALTSPAAPTSVDTSSTVAAIQALLSSGKITDPTDKRILEGATSFLRSLTGAEDISEITKHASAVAEVIAGYDMQGQEVPSEIDAGYLKLTILQCQFHINIVKAELQKTLPDKTKMQHPMVLALDVAKVLAKGYKDDSFLKEVQALQTQIDQL